ncbi:MAG: hypothetical protein J7497_13520, partial [Chitinophagaceae bacterium]|nr:hypothetical protein [Chitinophagaceae bacterium]
DFIVVFLTSVIIALPAGYIIMKSWLRNYAYHISLSVWPFAIAVVCIALVTFLLIGLQTVKAALSNPVKALRSE